MSTIFNFDAGAQFIVRIFKQHENNPGLPWANSYEFKASQPGTDTDLDRMVGEFVGLERAMHLPSTQFTRAEVATWEPDSHPYNPLAFKTYDLGLVAGQRVGGETGAYVGLRVALNLRRSCISGRSGKLYYRNVLTESDIEGAAGEEVLSDAAALGGELAAAMTLYHTADYFAGGTEKFRLSLIGVAKGGVQTSRPCTALQVHGVAFVSLNHRWFNRKPAAQGAPQTVVVARIDGPDIAPAQPQGFVTSQAFLPKPVKRSKRRR